MRFKYHERQEYAGFYAHAAFFYVGKQIQRRNPEVLVPVPLHPARQRKRGYNQADEVLEMSNALELPKHPSLMRPADYTKIEELNCLFDGKLHELKRSIQPDYEYC